MNRVDVWDSYGTRGLVDSWIRGFVDSWIRGFGDSWIRGLVDSWIRGLVDSGIRGFVWDSYGIRGSSVGWVRGAFASIPGGGIAWASWSMALQQRFFSKPERIQNILNQAMAPKKPKKELRGAAAEVKELRNACMQTRISHGTSARPQTG